MMELIVADQTKVSKEGIFLDSPWKLIWFFFGLVSEQKDKFQFRYQRNREKAVQFAGTYIQPDPV